MWMGAHGCVGVQGTGDTQKQDMLDLGSMAGEISPDIMFLQIRSKVSQMRAGG